MQFFCTGCGDGFYPTKNEDHPLCSACSGVNKFPKYYTAFIGAPAYIRADSVNKCFLVVRNGDPRGDRMNGYRCDSLEREIESTGGRKRLTETEAESILK